MHSPTAGKKIKQYCMLPIQALFTRQAAQRKKSAPVQIQARPSESRPARRTRSPSPHETSDSTYMDDGGVSASISDV